MPTLPERAPRPELRLLDPTTPGSLERGSRKLWPHSDRTELSSSGYVDEEGLSPGARSASGIPGHACVRPPSLAVGPIRGAGRQQGLSSPPAAAAAVRARCSPTVGGQLRLCLGPPCLPLARPPHTCSPRRAPSPSPAATPCDSGYGQDHRAGARDARNKSQHLYRLGSDRAGPPGAGPARGGAWAGAGPGRTGRPACRSRHLVARRRRRGANLAQASSESGPSPGACLRRPSSSEPVCPRKEQTLAGGGQGRRDASAGHQRPPTPPRSKVRPSQGSGSAALAQREMGGRSRREAWGGGFGEEGERGTSRELLPSLTATQRSTSSSYFYFLRVPLTSKMSASLLCRLALGPSSSFSRSLSRITKPIQTSSLWPDFLTFRHQWL